VTQSGLATLAPEQRFVRRTVSVHKCESEEINYERLIGFQIKHVFVSVTTLDL